MPRADDPRQEAAPARRPAAPRPMIHLFRRFRRPKLRATPLPREHVEIIERNVPAYAGLTAEERARLHQHVQVFLAEKRFEGAGGLELTDEIRVTIAAQACLLLLGNPKTDYYPYLRNIIVYPSTYVAPTKMQQGNLVTEGTQARLGEAWSQGGNLVLSWDAVKRGCCDTSDAHNVVLHEFAHVLDNEDGGMEGAPLLPSRSAYAPWARVLSAEFDNLRRDLARGADGAPPVCGAVARRVLRRRDGDVLRAAAGAP